jgi:hypothetical protein
MANTKTFSADQVIRLASTVSVIVLAGIAAVISYKHMYQLVLQYGETSWTAALLPVSVDGMIVVASMSLLVDSRQGRRSGLLPWVLLVLGSAASLAANVAVAEPSLVGRLIAAWPSCALIGAYELLMRQVRHTAAKKTQPAYPDSDATAEAAHGNPLAAKRASEDPHRLIRLAAATTSQSQKNPALRSNRTEEALTGQTMEVRGSTESPPRRGLAEGAGVQQSGVDTSGTGDGDIQRRAWRWAMAHRTPEGALPPGKVIGSRFRRSERWGRLVKQAGRDGRLDSLAS